MSGGSSSVIDDVWVYHEVLVLSCDFRRTGCFMNSTSTKYDKSSALSVWMPRALNTRSIIVDDYL